MEPVIDSNRTVIAIQIQIDLIMDEELEYADTMTDEIFDKWKYIITNTHSRKLRKKENLKKLINLE